MDDDTTWWEKVRGLFGRRAAVEDEYAERRRFVAELAARFWRSNTSLLDRPTECEAVEAARVFLAENAPLWRESGIDGEELAWSIGELWPGSGWKSATETPRW